MACPICSWTYEDREIRFLFETESWRVCLAPNQSLIGRCVVALKRHAGDLADLTEAEWLDFRKVLVRLESALRSAFDATLFNWSCYMNLAYRENPPDPHVHWWAVPRYDHIVHQDGWDFEDPHFGAPYDHQRWLDVPDELKVKISERILKGLDSVSGHPFSPRQSASSGQPSR